MRHVSGAAVRRPPAGDVPGPVRDRRAMHPDLYVRLRRPPLGPVRAASVSAREFAATFYVNPRRSPDFSGAFLSGFLLLMGRPSSPPTRPLLAAAARVQRGRGAPAGLSRHAGPGRRHHRCLAGGGRLFDRTGQRKAFVVAAAIIYAAAMFVIAAARSFDGYLVGMAVGGLGFGLYLAVDLALGANVVSPRSSWPSPTATTASCTRSPAGARCWGRPRSCRSAASARSGRSGVGVASPSRLRSGRGCRIRVCS